MKVSHTPYRINEDGGKAPEGHCRRAFYLWLGLSWLLLLRISRARITWINPFVHSKLSWTKWRPKSSLYYQHLLWGLSSLLARVDLLYHSWTIDRIRRTTRLHTNDVAVSVSTCNSKSIPINRTLKTLKFDIFRLHNSHLNMKPVLLVIFLLPKISVTKQTKRPNSNNFSCSFSWQLFSLLEFGCWQKWQRRWNVHRKISFHFDYEINFFLVN